MTDPVAPRLRRRRPAPTSSRCAAIPIPRTSRAGTSPSSTDKDGDGVFDARTIFVDGLSWPTGVVPYDGGVYHRRRPRHPLCEGHRRRRRGRHQAEGLHRLRHAERPGLAQRPPLGDRRLDLRLVREQRRRHPQPDQARGSARLAPGPRLPVQARRLGLRGDLRRRPVRPLPRRLGPSVRLQQQQPHPPGRPPGRGHRPQPALHAPGRADRHRRRGRARAGLPDQPGRALAGRPDPPARGRSGHGRSGCPPTELHRHRLLHLGLRA